MREANDENIGNNNNPYEIVSLRSETLNICFVSFMMDW